MELLERMREQLRDIDVTEGWDAEEIQVLSARPLTAEEAIGTPERGDYPILKGKEVMLEATFHGYRGQAFTDMPGNFMGTLGDVLALPLRNNFERAVLIASLNAVLRSLKRIEKTVHCRDAEPGRCARQLVDYVRERFGNPRIAFIGLQPGMVASLSEYFTLRVTDLDPENVNKTRSGVLIEDVSHTPEILEWGDIVLATGTTAVNNTLNGVIGKKPVIFYGVTIAGIAHLAGYEQYCFCGH